MLAAALVKGCSLTLEEATLLTTPVHKPGAVAPARVNEVETAAESCGNLRPSIHVGKALALIVCLNLKCKRHFPAAQRERSEYSREAKRAHQRAAEETKARKAILRAILDRVETSLPRPVQGLVALGFANDVWHEARKDIVSVLGWGEAKKTNVNDVIGQRIPKTSGQELSQALVALAVAKDLHAHGYGGGQPNILMAMAKDKVDAAKVRRAAAAGAKNKAGKAAKKPVPASARKKKGKRKA